MATTTAKAHPHAKLPAPANLAGVAVLIGKLPPNVQYPSGAALCLAAHPCMGTRPYKSLCTATRGVMRNNNAAVGRGNRYNGLTPAAWLAAYKAVQAQRMAAKAAAQAPVVVPA